MMIGINTLSTPLITCRMGVPSFRVDRITRMTRVNMAAFLISAVLTAKVFPRPTALVNIWLLVPPLIGTGLLSSTSLLIEESFRKSALLIGTPLFGCISIIPLIRRPETGILLLSLLAIK